MKFLATLVLLIFAAPLSAAGPEWVLPMKNVHRKFTGTPGTLALFGDSITVSLGFWSPLDFAPKNIPDSIGKPLGTVKAHLKKECWRDWRGAEYGNDGGKTIA